MCICNRKETLIVSGLSNTFVSRMLGFSIYVSNTTNKSEGRLCYKNYFTDISDLTRHWKVECVTIGQYVFFYNERLKGVTYPKSYSTYAYNDVCELMVLGKYLIFVLFLKCVICLFDLFSSLFNKFGLFLSK